MTKFNLILTEKRAKVKYCKRCGGDLYLDRDHYGLFISCLQCGAEINLEERMEYVNERCFR